MKDQALDIFDYQRIYPEELLQYGTQSTASPTTSTYVDLQRLQNTADPVAQKLMGLGKGIASFFKPETPLDYLGMALPAAKVSQGIRAFHGSPFEFEKFDVSKIGTGIGKQMRGYGLYFTKSEKKARSYKKDRPEYIKIGDEVIYKDGKQVSQIKDPDTRDLVFMNMGDMNQTIKKLQDDIQKEKNVMEQVGDTLKPYSRRAIAHLEGLLEKAKQLKPLVKSKSQGKVYEVDISAQSDELLDFNKPFSEQSDAVLNKLKNAPESVRMEMFGYDGTKKVRPEILLPNNKRMAQELDNVGIKGIKYEDANISYKSKDGKIVKDSSENYVIFDPRIIDIVKTYGVTVPVAGAILSNSDQEDLKNIEQ